LTVDNAHLVHRRHAETSSPCPTLAAQIAATTTTRGHRPRQSLNEFLNQSRFRTGIRHRIARSDDTSLLVLHEHHAVRPPGGADRDRTDDLLVANQALSQLSYGPASEARGRNQGLALHRRTRLAQSTRPNDFPERPARTPYKLRRNAPPAALPGGPGWTRTTDLTLIRRAL
jgi:hypothetical protein